MAEGSPAALEGTAASLHGPGTRLWAEEMRLFQRLFPSRNPTPQCLSPSCARSQCSPSSCVHLGLGVHVQHGETCRCFSVPGAECGCEPHFGSEQNEVKTEDVCDPVSYQSPEGGWFLEVRHVPSHDSLEILPLHTQSSALCICHGIFQQGSVCHNAPCTKEQFRCAEGFSLSLEVLLPCQGQDGPLNTHISICPCPPPTLLYPPHIKDTPASGEGRWTPWVAHCWTIPVP